jgi:PilZ domain
MCGVYCANTGSGWTIPVSRSLLRKNERKWPRLHLAIPVFVRARDGSGTDSLEFATAINISPGGALVVLRRSLPQSAVISLEIPSAPIGPASGLKTASRVMRGKAVWITHFDAYHLLGLKFDRPLSTDEAAISGKHLRKADAAV